MEGNAEKASPCFTQTAVNCDPPERVKTSAKTLITLMFPLMSVRTFSLPPFCCVRVIDTNYNPMFWGCCFFYSSDNKVEQCVCCGNFIFS